MSDPWATVRADFAEGMREVRPVLEANGFAESEVEFGKGSGGPFSEATFARGDRSLTFWLRSDSLSVIYRVGAAEVDHLGYMREVAGVGGTNQFPTYSSDAQRSFIAVRHDLEAFCADFLSGDGARVVAAAQHQASDSEMTPMQRLAAIESELRSKRRP